MSERTYIILLIFSFFVIGILSFLIIKKRKDDIIKVGYIREPLPQPRENTSFIQNSSCPMSDGTWGTVKGNMCERVISI